MHKEAREFCEKWQHSNRGHALDIGGVDINGHCRDLWPVMQWTILDNAISLEYGKIITHGDTTFIQADATTWEPDRIYNMVLCTEVLEHVPQWRRICDTIYNALCSGGELILTCAGPGRPPHSMIDGGPLRDGEWYNNIAAVDLYSYLDSLGFRVDMTSNHTAHDIYVHAVKH